jgi:hypothetical protein
MVALISSSDFPSQESFRSRHVANLDLETAQITRWIPSPLNACAADCLDRGGSKVVLLTATASNEQLLTAIADGAKGIVFKEAALP